MSDQVKCTWCNEQTVSEGGLVVATDQFLCYSCVKGLRDEELLQDNALIRTLLTCPSYEWHYKRIEKLLSQYPDNHAWGNAFNPENGGMNEPVLLLAVQWLKLNVHNPQLFFIGTYARTQHPAILEALFKWMGKGGQTSTSMPLLIPDLLKSISKYHQPMWSKVLKFTRKWSACHPDHLRIGTVIAALISATCSSYDISRGKKWHTTHKGHEEAWKVLSAWLNVAYYRTVEHRYAIDEAKKLLSTEQKRTELPKLVGTLVSVKADAQTILWAKESYEHTGLLWLLIQLLKHAPDPSLIIEAKERSAEWINSKDEEEFLDALMTADPGDVFTRKQAVSFQTRHPGSKYCFCSFCNKSNFEVEFLLHADKSFVCSRCILFIKDKAPDSDTEGSAECSFCKVTQSNMYRNLEYRICQTCVEDCIDLFQEEEIGFGFMRDALNGSSSVSLPDSIFTDETTECSFCLKLQKNCCSLFPGSRSQICDECYGTYSEKTNASREGRCSGCKDNNCRICGADFALCSSCIQAFKQQRETENPCENSVPPDSPCSMCNLKARIFQLGDLKLCTACITRLNDINNQPLFYPEKWQHVLCRIVRAEPGGYEVFVGKNHPGFLATRAKLKRGLQLSVQFFCWYRGRMMLKPRHSVRGA